MGMFDNVNFKCKCPVCGEAVNDFQTKEGPCLLETLEPLEVDNFYALCNNCDAWIEFTFISPDKDKRPNDIEDYIVYVKNTFNGYNLAVEHYKNPGEYKIRREKEHKEFFSKLHEN